MKLSTLAALALLPCLALGAPAYAAYRHHHHHSLHFGHHHRHHSFHHFRHRRHHAFHHHARRHAYSTAGSYRFVHRHHSTVPAFRPEIYAMVTRSAIEHGVPPSLAHGIVRVESGYNCGAYNAGASGIMQIKAASARSVGVFGGLRSCRAGLEAGMRYLRLAYEMAHGNSAYAATLYNRGLGARPSRSAYSHSVARLSSL